MCVTSKSSKSLYAKALIFRRDICPFWVGTSAEARKRGRFDNSDLEGIFSFFVNQPDPQKDSASVSFTPFFLQAWLLESRLRSLKTWIHKTRSQRKDKVWCRCYAKNESSYRMSKSGLSQHPCIFCESVWHSSLWEAGGELGPSNMVLSESALDEIQCNTVNMSVKKIQRLGRNRTTADWKARLQIRMIVFSRA